MIPEVQGLRVTFAVASCCSSGGRAHVADNLGVGKAFEALSSFSKPA